jgi:Heterokaryon incompatibility protein (HET)
MDLSSYYSAYKYRPLVANKEIRLLVIHDGEVDQRLTGSLIHVQLDKVPKYQAISYAWGSDVQDSYFQTAEGYLPITQSLHSAIRRIRKKDSYITVWADAICINQSDDHEKGHQVRLMRQIYASSETVLIYLGGDADDHSWDKAVHTLCCVYMETTTKGLESHSHGTSELWINHAPSAKDEVWNDLIKLFQLPWFQRVWIVQEVVVAKTALVILGQWEIPWDAFYGAVEPCYAAVRRIVAAIGDAHGRTYPNFDPVRKIEGLRRGAPLRSLQNLISFYAEAKSSRARDHLFAFLGIANDADDSAFDPDYTVPLEVVVKRYASVFVRQGHAIELITSAAGFRPSEETKAQVPSGSLLDSALNIPGRISGLIYDNIFKIPDRFPSWIPDWTQKSHIRIGTWAKIDGEEEGSFRACRDNKVDAQIGRQDDELRIRGTQVDVIRELSAFDSSFVEGYLLEVKEMAKSVIPYPTGESAKDLEWKVPIGNHNHTLDHDGRDPEASAKQLQESHSLLMEEFSAMAIEFVKMTEFMSIDKAKEEIERKGSNLHSTDALRYMYIVMGRLHFPVSEARCCVTERGYLGVVSGVAEVGDPVCIIYGAPAPFVLKKSIQRTGAYRLVSECYIHGIMDGESLLFPDIKAEVFYIH